MRRASTRDRVGSLGNWRMRKEALPSKESEVKGSSTRWWQYSVRTLAEGAHTGDVSEAEQDEDGIPREGQPREGYKTQAE